MRDTIFISHANPEDNEFSLWVALQLAAHGYPVWCDLTKLLGGEDFWVDIETAIRKRTIKFLFVLSKNSNLKPGVLKELGLAESIERAERIRDFIIPLHIDDLRHRDANISVHRLNSIPFDKGWAAGLTQLLAKLDLDEIPRHPDFTPTAVTAWWRSQLNASEGIRGTAEEYLSNWFPIRNLPTHVYFHHLVRYGGGTTEITGGLPFPAVKHGSYLISFAPAEDLRPAIHSPITLQSSETCLLDTFLSGDFTEIPVERKQARNYLSDLLRQAWWLSMEQRELPTYELSGGARCFYFSQGMAEQDRVHFLGVRGQRTFRQMVGHNSFNSKTDQLPTKRYWHFGLQLRPMNYPVRAYVAKPHVLFSSDGDTIWDSKPRLHRARRSACKNWWNAEWRDRVLAAITWLADGKDEITLALGADIGFSISALPVTFTSPVSYSDPEKMDAPVDVDLEDDDAWDILNADEVA